MCIINNCDKGYCLHFSMAVRERVALFIFIIIYLLINCSYSLPRKLSRTPKLENKIKKSLNLNLTEPGTSSKPKTNLRNFNMQTKIMNNAKQEDLCEKFNFPEIEYPAASTPNTLPFNFREVAESSLKKSISPNNNGQKISTQSRYPYSAKTDTTRRNRHQVKMTNNPTRHDPENNTMAEFSSAPSYRDMGVFPEVEFPQKAKDMWRPNYWNCPPKVIKPTKENFQDKTSNSGVRFTHSQFDKTNSFWSPTSQTSQNHKQSKKGFTSNQPTSINNNHDAFNFDFPKTESHLRNRIMPENNINSDNLYTATPMPISDQQEDPIKTALYAKIYSDIASRAISSIKNLLKSNKTSSTTENYGLPFMKESDILEDILRYSHPNFDDYDSYSLIHNNYYATTPRTAREYSYSSEVLENVTQPCINVLTAFTEAPEQFLHETSTKSSSEMYNINQYSKSILIDTSSSHLRDVISTKPDTTTLSPRAFIYGDRKLIYDKNNASILGQCNECDVSALDKIAVMSYNNDTESDIRQVDRSDKTSANNTYDSFLKLDDEYTTDVYPEVKENRSTFVLSTMAPLRVTLDDPSWDNSEIIDPYKSISHPDELEEYYIAVG